MPGGTEHAGRGPGDATDPDVTQPWTPPLSASLPAVYPARIIEGRSYIDGGVLNEIHTTRAVELGATELYVLHVGHLDDRMQDVQRPFDGALRAYWTHRRFRLEDDLTRVPGYCKIHRLPAGATPRLRFDDFSHGPELSEIAYVQSTEYLRNGSGAEPLPVLETDEPHRPGSGEIADWTDEGSE